MRSKKLGVWHVNAEEIEEIKKDAMRRAIVALTLLMNSGHDPVRQMNLCNDVQIIYRDAFDKIKTAHTF